MSICKHHDRPKDSCSTCVREKVIDEISERIAAEAFKPVGDLWEKMKDDIDSVDNTPADVQKAAKEAIYHLLAGRVQL